MTLVGSCKYRSCPGILSINSGNIVFTRQDRGLFSQREVVVATIPTTAIISMNVEAAGLGIMSKNKNLVILVDQTKIPGVPRHEFEVSDPYHFMKIIQNEIDSQLAKQSQPHQLVKEVYVKEVTSVVKVPCPYCGVLNEVTEKKCSGCGSVIGEK